MLRLAPRPVFLAGREELLAELDARLAGDDGAGPRVVALCGLGGAGKTSVALEYAHRHLAEVGVCWQFPAEDPAVLAAEFGDAGRPAGRREVADRGIRWPRCMGCWPRPEAGWLLVFDNVPDRASVAPFVPPAGPGRVLITSRTRLATRPGPGCPGADPEVAADFLVDRTGDPDAGGGSGAGGRAGRAAAGAGAGRRLHAGHRDHPGPVPAIVPGPAGGPAGPRRGLRASGGRGRHLGAGVVPAGRPTPRRRRGWCGCWRSWPPSRSRCGSAAPPPGQAAGRWARRWRPLGPLLGDPVAAGDAITALRRYSLVSPAGDGLVLVHRLVQAVTRAQLPGGCGGPVEQAAAALVEAAVPADAELPAAWPVCAVLLPHARAVLDLTSGGMWQIAQYLGYSGSYRGGPGPVPADRRRAQG